METVLPSCKDNVTATRSNNNLSNFSVVLPSEAQNKLQVFFDRLKGSVAMFAMRFAPLNCKVLLQGWIGSRPKPSSAGEELGNMGEFHYLDSYVSPGETTW